MKIIGRYSTLQENSGELPENSLVIFDIGTAFIDTYDRSELCSDSRCHLRLTTANGKYHFKVGCPENSGDMSKETAEKLMEAFVAEDTVDLRTYDGLRIYGRMDMICKVDTMSEEYPLNVYVTGGEI